MWPKNIQPSGHTQSPWTPGAHPILASKLPKMITGWLTLEDFCKDLIWISQALAKFGGGNIPDPWNVCILDLVEKSRKHVFPNLANLAPAAMSAPQIWYFQLFDCCLDVSLWFCLDDLSLRRPQGPVLGFFPKVCPHLWWSLLLAYTTLATHFPARSSSIADKMKEDWCPGADLCCCPPAWTLALTMLISDSLSPWQPLVQALPHGCKQCE